MWLLDLILHLLVKQNHVDSTDNISTNCGNMLWFMIIIVWWRYAPKVHLKWKPLWCGNLDTLVFHCTPWWWSLSTLPCTNLCRSTIHCPSYCVFLPTTLYSWATILLNSQILTIPSQKDMLTERLASLDAVFSFFLLTFS